MEEKKIMKINMQIKIIRKLKESGEKVGEK